MSRPRPLLKSFYYLDHFEEVIGVVELQYGDVLSSREWEFVKGFRSLQRDARALLVRMANRKGRCFPVAKLMYAEIDDGRAALSQLREAGLVAPPQDGDLGEVLETLAKTELLALLKAGRRAIPGASGLRKAELIERMREMGGWHALMGPVRREDFVILQNGETLDFIRYLYFGGSRDNLTSFALRDLGLVRTKDRDEGVGRRFANREVARAAFRLSVTRQEIETASVPDLMALGANAVAWPSGPTADVCERHHKCVVLLGRSLERAGKTEMAEAVYALSREHPCRERRVRLLWERGRRDRAGELLDEIIKMPASDEELLFAEDFKERKLGLSRVGVLTRILREAPLIEADESQRDAAERAAMRHFETEGWQAFWVENHFWSALFGVTFWDELRTGTGSESASEFDFRPISLRDGSFYEANRTAIEATLSQVGAGELPGRVAHVFAEHFGDPNGVFQWRAEDALLLEHFLNVAPKDAVVRQLRALAKRPGAIKGYPDLLLLNAERACFVEVKGEGDQLQRHQLARIRALDRRGFEVSVLRVKWIVDPRQEYVVVDLETTGRQPGRHAITEIGALRVRGGEVVGTFHTLLNPGCRIPVRITRLTGISDEMVSNAPRFAEIADEFRAFLDGAVFVAHNAKFDYGFVRAAFSGLGEVFASPSLCTVVGMRKYYPGRTSYSLGKLCAEFEIPLADHHRALCDAHATFELLKLINRKRGEH